MFHCLHLPAATEGNQLLSFLQSARNPFSELNDLAGPSLQRVGGLVGALNNQVYAGANTVSAAFDGYKKLEETNPEAPLVRTVQTFEDIFRDDPQQEAKFLRQPADHLQNEQQTMGSTGDQTGLVFNGPKFDPVSAFMGDGKESVNLNDLINTTVGGVGGAPDGGGILSKLMGNQAAQGIMSRGAGSLIGVMQHMQSSMGPGSANPNKILPSMITLAQGGLKEAAQVGATQSTVPSITAVKLHANSTTATESGQYQQLYQLPDGTSTTHSGVNGNSLSNNNYSQSQQQQQLQQSSFVNNNNNIVSPTTISDNINGGQIGGGGNGQFSNLFQGLLAGNVAGGNSPIGGLIGGLGGLGGGEGANTMLQNLPAKAAEAFSLAQAFNSGDTSQMASSMTSLIGSASNVMSKVSAMQGGVGNGGGNGVIGGQSYDENDTTTTIDSIQETSPKESAMDALNKKIMGNQHTDVMPLPAWMTAVENNTRRLEESREPCYLSHRNLIGAQLTNMRSWDILNCQALCSNYNGCLFWTFLPQIALCYLYDSVTGSIHTNNAVSGPRECPAGTDSRVPEDMPAANDFLLGLVNPVQKILSGQSASKSNNSGELTGLQRLITGADGENIVSSVMATGDDPDSTFYHMMGSKFADGFESGGSILKERLPDAIGGILGDPDAFKKQAMRSNGVLLDSNEIDTLYGMANRTSANTPLPKVPQTDERFLQKTTDSTTSINSNTQPGAKSPLPVQSILGQTNSSSNANIFDTSSSVVRASSKFMDTVPMMDFAKAGYQIYNSGFFKKNGIFGGNATGDKLSSLPPLNLGVPRVVCNWQGMQCCVPRAAVPRKFKNDPISLNGVTAPRCQAIDYFENDTDELCVTVRFENSSASCNTTKYNLGTSRVYQATMNMPGKMNNGLCECVLDEGAGTIKSNADWQVNMISMREMEEKEKAAEQSAEKLRKSASTAMAWTRMISDTARSVGSAALGGGYSGDNNVSDDGILQPTTGGGSSTFELMGEGSRWSDALQSLTQIKETVSRSRAAVASSNRTS